MEGNQRHPESKHIAPADTLNSAELPSLDPPNLTAD